MLTGTISDYVVSFAGDDASPDLVDDYAGHARLVERFGMEDSDERLSFVTVRKGAGWPFLVIVQRYSPSGSGFHPGIILVPETNVLFVGAGERVLAYDLVGVRRLWEDDAEMGFLGWERHADVVVMSAELELAAWSLDGKKLWTTFVEPPWGYTVAAGQVELDVMGNRSRFDLRRGPG